MNEITWLSHGGPGSGRYPKGSGENPRSEKVFISGSSKTQNKKSPYYRRKLPRPFRKQIKSHLKNKDKILVGEAPGIDTQVQDYLKSKRYKNVEVYTTGEKPRYLANKKWKVNNVDTKNYKPDTKEYLKQKDIAMTNDANKGLSVILEKGGAGATRNNVKRLVSQNKDVKVYMLKSDKKDEWVKDIVSEIINRKS